ncbi:MAG: hypothetical protein HOV68_16175, partial [Streptomycetaceae bacterium]|nr:hypothetical protein [Streptomycetaceae bacterium]
MKPQVNIIALVDVIGALSDQSLHNGNLSLVDNGDFESTGQGTPDLVTIVRPGQIVQWQALAVDLQTPAEIRSITFSGPGLGNGSPGASAAASPSVASYLGPGVTQPSASATATAPTAATALGTAPMSSPAAAALATDSEKLDLEVWIGVVPGYLIPGRPYHY